jgi:type I restriction enzyme S subunit
MFVLRSPLGRRFMNMWANTTAQPTLNLKDLGNLPIPIPPAHIRGVIAAILGALDDRIALLRETNATLEFIAQALFKSWFVDFDPVRAKQQGLVPAGMDEATAALFPDGFEDSALGSVPQGWRALTVASIADIVKGKSYSSKDLVAEHNTALVTLKSFERGGGCRLDGFKPYAGTYKASQVIASGDLIVAYTDVTQAAELIGKPAVVVGVDEHSTLVASLDVGIIRPLETRTSRQFLYGLFKTDAFQAHTFAHTSGTTVLHLSKDAVGSFRFACPPYGLMATFSSVAESLANRRQVNVDQMRNLTSLRDTLLPRLISGQLRLPETEARIDEALV